MRPTISYSLRVQRARAVTVENFWNRHEVLAHRDAARPVGVADALRYGLERTIPWTRENQAWIEECVAGHTERTAVAGAPLTAVA